METAGGRSAGAGGRFERCVACIGDLSALGAAAPDPRVGFQGLRLLRCQVDDAAARTSEASFVRHLSPCASWRVCAQAAR